MRADDCNAGVDCPRCGEPIDPDCDADPIAMMLDNGGGASDVSITSSSCILGCCSKRFRGKEDDFVAAADAAHRALLRLFEDVEARCKFEAAIKSVQEEQGGYMS